MPISCKVDRNLIVNNINSTISSLATNSGLFRNIDVDKLAPIGDVSEEHRGIVGDINTHYGEPILQKRGDNYQISPSEATVLSLLKQANKIQPPQQGDINYQLKSVDILSSDKAAKWFSSNKGLAVKFPDVFWSKMQADLQIPKEQLALLRSLQTTDKDEMIIGMLSTYSYTMQVNTAKSNVAGEFDEEGQFTRYDDVEQPAPGTNSQVYANMTVPGGTNYTENEIAIPGITPSIRGHAQFSTNNGIGWMRSDDRDRAEKGEIKWTTDKAGKEFIFSTEKTRRILEIQSDLFQKGRDRLFLDQGKLDRENSDVFFEGYEYHPRGAAIFKGAVGAPTAKLITRDEFNEVVKKAYKNNENDFLQLLNKDNTWVTVFVKSIIQDSAKKGYEKVLFPVGDTAAKVEGHVTLTEFIAFREKRINLQNKKLENPGNFADSENFYREDSGKYYALDTATKEEEEINKNTYFEIYNNSNEAKSITRERDQLQKEVEEAKAGKLKISAIARFYETTVFNILKKQGYSPTRIEDEHKNGWYEVAIKPEHLQQIQFAQPFTEQESVYSEKTLYQAADIEETDTPYEFIQKHSPYKDQISKFFKANPGLVLEFGEGNSMFDPNTNHILISLPELYEIAQKAGIPFKTVINAFIMHEMGHAASFYALQKGKNDEFVMELLTKVKEWHKTQSFEDQLRQGVLEDGLPYAFKNIHEFVADAFGNPYFQDYLKKIPADEKRSVWQKFIDWVLSLFGVKRDSVYDKVVDYINSDKIQKDNEEGSIHPDYEQMYITYKGNPRDYVDAATEYFTSDAIKPLVEKVFADLPSAVAKLKDLSKLQKDPEQRRRIQSLLDAFNEVKGKEDVVGVYVNMLVSAAAITRDLNDQMNVATKMTDDLKKIYTMHSLLASAENLQFIVPLVTDIVRIVDTEGGYADANTLKKFVNQLRGILSVESTIKATFIKTITPSVQNFYSSLYPNNVLAEAIRARIDSLNAKIADEKSTAKDRRYYNDEIERQQKLLLKLPTSEVFDKIFAGKFTDASSLQMWLETAAVNSHPLIATTVSLLRDLDISISQDMLHIENNHQRKFTKVGKDKNLSLRNPTKTWDPIFDIVNDVNGITEDENGKVVVTHMKRKMFTSQYQPAYLQKHFEFRDLRDFYYDKYLAAKRANDEAGIEKYYSLYSGVVKEKQAFEKENSERRYKDEVYDMFGLMDKAIPMEDGKFTSFRKERGDIFREIENLEHQRDRATNLDDAKEYQERIKQKTTELRELRSAYDGAGVLKTGVPLEIANIANEYYKLRYEYGESVLTPEGKAAFDAAIIYLKDKLSKQQITQEQFDARINAITVTELEAEYFEKIAEYSNLIAEATARIVAIPELASTYKGMNRDNIKNGYQKLKDLTKAFRDADGVIDGVLFTKVHPELVKQIKDIQQELEDLKNKSAKLKNLSTEDSILFNELIAKDTDGSITMDEKEQLANLKVERSSLTNAYKNNKALIDDYYNLLSKMSDLVDGSVSEYYIEEKDNQLNKIIASLKKGIEKEVMSGTSLEGGEYFKQNDVWWKVIGKDPDTGANRVAELKDEDDYSSAEKVVDEVAAKRAQPMLEASDWWKDNHYTYYSFDKNTMSYFPLERPIYIWMRTEPKNKEYIKAGQPSFKFKTYQVKDAWKNEKHREILPYIPVNKADKYVNEKYAKMDSTWKDYLEFLREESYKAQEFYPREKKLGDLLPGIVKSSGELKVEATNRLLSAKNPLKGLRDFVFEAKEEDDTNVLLGGSQSKYYVNERVLPTRFVGKIEADKQSSDVPGMILALILAARKYNKLLEIHPVLESTRTIVGELDVQESTRLGKKLSLVNLFSTVKNLGKTALKTDRVNTKHTESSNLAKTLDFVLDTMMYGHTKDASISQILGVNFDWQKISTALKQFSSTAIFSLNTFVAVKNTGSAKVGGFINSNVGRGFYTNTDLLAANWKAKNYIKDHFSDYKKFGDKSEIGQKLAYFQVLRGTTYNAYGQKTQWTDLKNVFNYLSIVKNISEFELQVTQFLAMSRANKVKIGDKEVPFDEAFVLNKNGDLEKLPDAQVTEAQKFAFIKKVGWINRNINGAYKADERNRAQKTVLGDLAFYLNGYVMPGILNRYADSRYSIEAETITRGYWNQGFSFLKDLAVYRRGLNKQWGDLDADERARVHRWLKELGFIVAFAFLVAALGGGDDKDELRKNMAFQNYMLALAMSIKSETETFAPLPSMGLNEFSRKLNSPFAALKQVSNIIKVLENGFGYAIHSVNSEWYQKSVYKRQGVHDGFHDPGDAKVVANFLKLIGWTGTAFDPLERVTRVRQIQQLR